MWVEALIEAMAVAINENDKLQLEGLGTFAKKRYGARTYNKPKTTEKIPLPARYKLKFIPSSALKVTITEEEMALINDEGATCE